MIGTHQLQQLLNHQIKYIKNIHCIYSTFSHFS